MKLERGIYFLCIAKHFFTIITIIGKIKSFYKSFKNQYKAYHVFFFLETQLKKWKETRTKPESMLNNLPFRRRAPFKENSVGKHTWSVIQVQRAARWHCVEGRAVQDPKSPQSLPPWQSYSCYIFNIRILTKISFEGILLLKKQRLAKF